MAGSQDDIPPPPPSQTPTQQTPHTEVIQNGNGPVSISTDTQGQIKILPPKTAEEILARERERKARTTLLMALPEDHLAKFHKMTDAKEMWEAIKSRFGGNDESKKMQKFQSLLSQLEIHGAGVSTEDANQKFLRSLPSAWSQVSTASSSSTQNVAFVLENISSTNDFSTAYGVSNPSGQNSQYELASSYSLLANQSSCPQLDHEDLEQLDEFDLEEMDLKWQEPVGFDKTKVECYSCHKTGHFARESKTKGNQDSRRRDAWNSGNKDRRRSEEEDYALMACSSSGSDTEVTFCSKECKESYAKLKKLYDAQREQLGYASIEIQAYTQALKKVEAQLVAHQQGQLCQMSANDKFGLGYRDYRYDGILSYENEVLQSVFINKESDLENQPLYDRFVTAEGMHVVPPPMTRNYMPSGPDIEIDDSQFTYGPKQSQASEFETQTSDFDTCDSNCSDKTHESLLEPAVNEPKVVSQPKVWYDAPIIEEYESDSEDEHVSLPTEKQETPSFANKQVKTPRETVKKQFTHSKNPKVDKKGLGYGFTTKACFVCGSLSHLIRDCDFHEKRMAKQAELNNRMRKKSSQREIRPIWNNVQRMNHRNQFVPKAVLTRTGKIPINTVNTARHNVNRQAVPTNAANIVNTVKPIVNNARPKSDFHKSVSPFRKSLNRTTTLRTKFSYQKVNITEDYPHRALQNKGIVDSRCSRHMTRNKAYLAEYQDFNGGPVAFICDKKNKVLFTDSECLVLSPEFKLPDANQVLLRIPRQNNMYSFNLENIVPYGGLACIIAKATIDESNKWHRRDFIELCGSKGIKREYSNARTPQQNGVAERKNRTLIEAARTMLADSFLPNTFWAEAVSTACYVLNRVLVTKPQNKTPYELITGKIPIISYIRPFGCHVTILNTIDHLGKFDGKSDEGFLVGYSLQSKAFRGKDQLGCIEDNIDAGDSKIEAESAQDYFILPIWSSYTSTVKSSKVNNAGEEPTKHPDFKQVDKEDQVFLDELERLKRQEQDANDAAEALRKEFAQETEDLLLQAGAAKASSTNIVNTASTPVSTASPYGGLSFTDLTNTDQDDSEIPALEEIYDNPTDGIFTNSSYDDEGAVADFTNLEPVVNVSPIPTSRINYIHPSTLILGDPQSAVQTRSKVTKTSRAHAFSDLEALEDESWVDAMQEELQEKGIDYDEVFAPVAKIEAIRIFLAFASYMGFIVYQMDVKSSFLYGKIDEEVYVSQPLGFIDPKYPKKVYKVVKALYGLHQAPRAWYATLSTFLLKNGYRRGTIDKTLFIKKDKHDIILVQVYVDDIIFGSTKRSWCDEFETLMKSRFQMSSMGELTFFLGLQVKQKEDGIFISQDKYVAEILKKFDFVSVKTASTPIETQKPLVKDEEASDVDVHLYRSMIGSLMYLTASRPDIMFAVCACSRFQVNPKTSHLSAVKRIFRYLKGKPKLGLWYPRVSSFDLEAYSDSDYAGANLDRKSTTGGCQFLGKRLISWQCKKQTIVATSTTKAEYVAAANCCGQVLWIQNQMLDYGFNFMNTHIYIDNESTICIVKNPIFYSKTNHIAIRHHFIRDAYEKKLIQVLKIHTDDNVADLLTKAFDVSRESLGRALDGTKALLLPYLFILWLAKVSTDSAKLIPLGKDSTAIDTLKKIPPKIFMRLSAFLREAPFIMLSLYITAKVAGKPVSISEASIRSDLLFDDADGIDSLPNQAIFDAIQLMGYEGDLIVLTFNKALFSPQ
ncbi:putative ribonuclease H-like domain-containing protein [Tanacetum coccineum]